MTSTYDSTGIVADRYADILARLETLSEAQWGTSSNVLIDEITGHIYRNISLILGELNDKIQSIYDAFSVSNSQGAQLDNLIELVNMSRDAAAYSTVTLTLTATQATTVPAGTRYATATEVIFATDAQLVFAGAGSDTIAATCTVVGANEAGINEVSVIKDSVFGISTCTNAASVVPGRLRETDAQVKESHSTTTATSGQDDAASIYEAVDAVSGTSAILVDDNDSNVTRDGVPAHNIHVSVIGGAAADVAEAIANNKTCGVPTYGSSSESVYSSTTGQSRTIYFSTGSLVTCYIDLTITKSGNFPDDGEEQIKTNLVAHFDNYKLKDTVRYTSLYEPVYSVGGLFINTLYVNTTGSPTVGDDNDITMTATQKANLISSNIVISVI
jgi:hypothetical protein